MRPQSFRSTTRNLAILSATICYGEGGSDVQTCVKRALTLADFKFGDDST